MKEWGGEWWWEWWVDGTDGGSAAVVGGEFTRFGKLSMKLEKVNNGKKIGKIVVFVAMLVDTAQ